MCSWLPEAWKKDVQNLILLDIVADFGRLGDTAPFWTLEVVFPGISVCTNRWQKAKLAAL